MVLTVHRSQVQHVLREGEQDLCHLQGGKETGALRPAGHHVVCGGPSMRWPSGGGWGTWPGLVSAEKLHLVGAFSVQGPAGRKGIKTTWKGEGSLGRGAWGGGMLAGFRTDLSSHSDITTF